MLGSLLFAFGGVMVGEVRELVERKSRERMRQGLTVS